MHCINVIYNKIHEEAVNERKEWSGVKWKVTGIERVKDLDDGSDYGPTGEH